MSTLKQIHTEKWKYDYDVEQEEEMIKVLYPEFYTYRKPLIDFFYTLWTVMGHTDFSFSYYELEVTGEKQITITLQP